MSSETFAILIWFWNDLQSHTTMVRVQRLDTGEDIQLQEGSFLLRLSTEEDAAVARCLIRHLTTGREVHIQSGPGLEAFIRSSFLDTSTTLPPPETGTV